MLAKAWPSPRLPPASLAEARRLLRRLPARLSLCSPSRKAAPKRPVLLVRGTAGNWIT